jgi:hypothetical protein
MDTHAFKRNTVAGLICMLALWLAVCPVHGAISGIAKSPAKNLTVDKSWAQMSAAEKGQLICAISGALVLFVSEIWFIVAGFKTSVGWGLFMLFIGGMRSIAAAFVLIGWIVRWILLTRQSEPLQLPLALVAAFVVFAGGGAIIFIIRHWKQARHPLAMMGLGILLLAVVVGLEYVK